ncbi:MAG: DUF998 domain-containing protein [Gemmatimonadaceae bacterium]
MATLRALSPFALAGILGPLCFTVLVIVEGMLSPDYSHVRLPISALAAYPTGWLQRLNFYQLGALMAFFTIGLHRAVGRTHYGGAGIGLLLLNAAGLFVAGTFSWIMVDGVPTETAPHVAGAVMAFAGAGLGLMALAPRLRTDPRWRALATYTLATGATILALFVLMATLAIPDSAPLHRWVGLIQRIVVALWFACTIALATQMWRFGAARTVDE